jgi:hypothetical protein
MIPEFVVQEGRDGQINLNTSEWLILSKIDGQRSVKSIAFAASLSVFDAAKILYGLIATGLIRLHQPAASSRAVTRPAAAARPGTAAAAPSAATPHPARDMITRLDRVRDVCNGLLGAVGESVVNKHYLKARSELERGGGAEAIDEAIGQIARAASILKGPHTTESLLEQLKAIK